MASAPPPQTRANVANVPAVDVQPIGDTLADRSHLNMQETLTISLIGVFCAVIALAFVVLILTEGGAEGDAFFKNLKTLLDVVVGPLITLLSTVIGFYFGTQSMKPKDKRDG